MVMKKKRILFGCFIAALSLSISACDFLPENLFNNANKRSSSEETSQRSRSSRSSSSKSSSTHVHTFSEDWEFNETSHWHPSSCGHNVKSEISPHDYYSVVTKEPTCVSEGEIIEVCTVCDYRRTRSIPTAEHSWIIYDRIEPTCEEPGLYRKLCSYCGQTTTETVEPLGHSLVTQSYIPSTCSTPGEVIEVCTRCGRDFHTEVPSSPHNWGYESYQYSSRDGLVSYSLRTCRYCGATRIAINVFEGQNYSLFKTGVSYDYGYVKLNSNGSSVTYSFDYPYNAYGTMYQHGVFENPYSSSAYYYNSYTYGAMSPYQYNFQVSLNDQDVDLYLASQKTYEEMLSGGEYVYGLSDNNYSPAADCLIGDIALAAGTNTFTYTRTGRYNLCVDYFVFVVYNTDHVHTKSASWYSDENSHWYRCIDPDCPVPNAKIEAEPHTFSEPVVVMQPTCHSEGLQRETCIYCQYNRDTILPTSDHDYQSIGAFETADNSVNLEEYGCSTCNKYAYRWSALQFDQTLSTNVDTTNSQYVRFQSSVENANGEISTGSHIVYKINMPVTLTNVGLAFNVSQSNGYPVFASISGSSQGYVVNQYGDLEQATKRYGLRVNGVEITLGDEDYTFSGNSSTHQWFNWPVKFNLVAGINTIDFYCLSSSYRGRMYEFQITNVPYVEPNHIHTPNAYYDFDDTYHYYSCTANDGAMLNKEEHQFSDYVVSNEPTCDGYGSQSRTCLICGYVQTMSLSPNGHSYDNYYVVQDPTCTEYGIQESTCTICGHVERWSIDPYGHSWDEGVIIVQPTHTEPGEKMYTCLVCGETKTEAVKPDHNWGSTYSYGAHDGYAGYTLQHCLDDGAKKIDIKAIDGDFGGNTFSMQNNTYVRPSSNGQTINYKIDYDSHSIGKLYLRGFMTSYSSNKNRTFASSAGSLSTNGCSFEITVNNTSVDMSEVKDVPFFDMLDNGWIDPDLSTSYSPVANCLIGTVELFPGENTITYLRTGSYNLYFSDLIFVVEDTNHTHTYDGSYVYDGHYHWHECIDPNCPMRDTALDKVAHNYVRIEASGSYSCNEQGTSLYKCVDCGYETFVGGTSEHTFESASTVSMINSEGKEVLYRYCVTCGRTVASMPFANGTFYNGSYDSGKLKSGTSVKWKIPVYNAAQISIYLPCKMTSGNTGQTFDPSLYELYVNGVACNILLSKGTYDELGITSTETGYFKFATYAVTEQDIRNGEIEITFTSNVSSYRMIFDGEIRIDY